MQDGPPTVYILLDACELCGSTRNLRLDHNHRTGMMRGTLCHRCNLGMALMDTLGPDVLTAYHSRSDLPTTYYQARHTALRPEQQERRRATARVRYARKKSAMR